MVPQCRLVRCAGMLCLHSVRTDSLLLKSLRIREKKRAYDQDPAVESAFHSPRHQRSQYPPFHSDGSRTPSFGVKCPTLSQVLGLGCLPADGPSGCRPHQKER